MKLWLISQDVNRDYDTYDSAVVAAETEDAARRTDPGQSRQWVRNAWHRRWQDGSVDIGGHAAWVDDLDQITVKLIGEAAPGIEAGVICASFNAG
jgi:hypothetical protein